MATEIYCPKCEWEPRASDRWWCTPGCLTSWNTFDTHGLCPGCNKQWHVTQCLSCRAMSPHDDWYHEVDPHHDEISTWLAEPATRGTDANVGPARDPSHNDPTRALGSVRPPARR